MWAGTRTVGVGLCQTPTACRWTEIVAFHGEDDGQRGAVAAPDRITTIAAIPSISVLFLLYEGRLDYLMLQQRRQQPRP